MKFILLDLERTSGTNKVYWKAGNRGYTRDILEAGSYDYKEAINICNEDIEGNTLMLPETYCSCSLVHGDECIFDDNDCANCRYGEKNK